MKPIKFPGQNVTYGEGQPQYQPLPAMHFPDGQVITCWEFTPEELEKIQKTGKMYISQLTFNNKLQPILPAAELDDISVM